MRAEGPVFNAVKPDGVTFRACGVTCLNPGSRNLTPDPCSARIDSLESFPCRHLQIRFKAVSLRLLSLDEQNAVGRDSVYIPVEVAQLLSASLDVLADGGLAHLSQAFQRKKLYIRMFIVCEA